MAKLMVSFNGLTRESMGSVRDNSKNEKVGPIVCHIMYEAGPYTSQIRENQFFGKI